MRNRMQYRTGQLGQLESKFIAWVQLRRQDIVRMGEAGPVLGLSAEKERDLLRRLARAGWIVRLQRGLYLAPRTLPVGGGWNPSESIVLPALMRARGGKYQICGPTSFIRYGFDDQVPNCVFIYNNCLSGKRQIGSTRYVFIRVADDRLGSVEMVKTPDGEELVYSSRTRALIDALYDWSRFNGIPRAFAWIRKSLQEHLTRPVELARVAVRFGNQSTLRRLGYILRKTGLSPKANKIIRKALRRSDSLVALVPSKSRKGQIIKEWGVIDNE